MLRSRLFALRFRRPRPLEGPREDYNHPPITRSPLVAPEAHPTIFQEYLKNRPNPNRAIIKKVSFPNGALAFWLTRGKK